MHFVKIHLRNIQPHAKVTYMLQVFFTKMSSLEIIYHKTVNFIPITTKSLYVNKKNSKTRLLLLLERCPNSVFGYSYQPVRGDSVMLLLSDDAAFTRWNRALVEHSTCRLSITKSQILPPNTYASVTAHIDTYTTIRVYTVLLYRRTRTRIIVNSTSGAVADSCRILSIKWFISCKRVAPNWGNAVL